VLRDVPLLPDRGGPQALHEFRHLTGRFGAEVPPTALACKYHEGK